MSLESATMRDIITLWSVEGPFKIADLAERLEAEHGDLVTACMVAERQQWIEKAIRDIVVANREGLRWP